MTPPYIPATALDGTLFPRPVRLGGWIGWCEWEWSPGTWSARTFDAGLPTRGDVRFDPRDPGVAHRIADILRRKGHEVGHLLPVALGGRVTDATVEERMAQDEGGGTLRRTIPAADVSAVLLAASVAGVEAGRGVVLGVVEPLDVTNCRLSCETYAGRTCYWTMDEATRNECRGPREIAPTFAGEHDGWCWGDLYGPETGQAAIARIYAAVHAAGWARLDPTAPFGVVVPFLNLENER